MQTKQIHIKATCENENRRFCISEAKFETLKQMISHLFSIESGNEFTLKYKDDENDLVTISSDEELAFAVNLFPTDILRIVIDFSKQKSDSTVCAEPKWHKKCKFPMDEKRCHFINAKRERVLACLKELEGTDFQAHPKLLWKQEHLKRKLQKLDSKIANKDSTSCGDDKHSVRGHLDWKGPSDERRCHFLAAKKEKILARLKELEEADFQANPGLQWKKDHLVRKLQFIEAKLANKDAPGNFHPRCGGRGGFHHGHHGPHGMMGPHHGPHHGGFRSGPWHQGHPGPMGGHGQMGHSGWAMRAEKRCHFLVAKKERIETCLKEMEGVDLQANPGLFWKQEHLKRKLQKIENQLAYSKSHASNVSAEVGTSPMGNQEPVPETVLSHDIPDSENPEEVKRIREALKNDKRQAVLQWKAKKEAFHTVKRLAGDQKEELAKLHEELMKAKEEAFQRKRALCEFKAKTRASREEDI